MIMGIFYLQRDYIAKNLCVNRFDKLSVCKGQCYLNKKLEYNDTEQQKIPEIKVKEIELNLPIITVFEYHTLYQESTIYKIRYRNTLHVFDILNSIFHPPQIV